MYTHLLSKRLRVEYRKTFHKPRIDDRTTVLFKRGYAQRTVRRYISWWVDFVQSYEGTQAVLPADGGCTEVTEYLKNRYGRNTYANVRSALQQFLRDEIPTDQRLQLSRKRSTDLFHRLVPEYLDFKVTHRGVRSSRALADKLTPFFRWLDKRGFTNIQQLTAGHVRDYFSNLEGLSRTTVSGHASALRCFLRYLQMRGTLKGNLAAAVDAPRVYRRSRPPTVLTEDTIERLLAAVDRSTALGKRDFAILMLASRYGLRPCDIRSLRFDHIHWREQRVVLLQAKTQCPLELPLLKEVDEALVDYIRYGRPPCAAREIFLRHTPPIGPLGKNNRLWDVMRSAISAAGIEPWAGCQGLSVLRHSAATRMLGRGVAIDTISDVLGHVSVESTRVYTQVDLVGLRSVVMTEKEVCP